MTALKTLKQLKLDRRNFYSQIYTDEKLSIEEVA